MRKVLIMAAWLFGSQAMAIEPGDSVPDIAAASTSGSTVKLTDYKGSWVVLYFFPRTFTPGCTAQSCSLRDEYSEIKERGVVLLGVSLDDTERQKEFKKEYNLPFELLSDTDKALSKAFDSLGLGGLMASRKTFIINPEGKLAFRFDKAQTSNHADELIAELDRLQKPAEPAKPTDKP